jgi:hypothetical protein
MSLHSPFICPVLPLPALTITEENAMLKSTLTTGCLVAITAAAMATLSTMPASAFTLAAPSLAQPVAAAQIDHVWWDRWGRWHPNVYGYGYGVPFVAPVPAPYYGYYGRRCWRGYYGRLHCAY